MQFSYHENASDSILEIENDLYKYLIKARRHKIGDEIYFRNLIDQNIYLYQLDSIDRRKAIFSLLSSEEKTVENSRKLHIGWCLVDPKTVEKSIASLNEIGVDEITFIYCEYTQKNFSINFEKLEKILINSSSQCGRSSIIRLNSCDSLENFLKDKKDIYFLDFSRNSIDESKDNIKTLSLGCEGGFSQSEREIFQNYNVVGFDSNLILKSETAIISAASKILI